MIAQLVAFAILGSTGIGVHAGPVEISLNVKDGDTISGEYKFRVGVTTDELINQVEFYVGDDLRDTKSSVPYEFKLDTLDPNQPEGKVKLTFAAYTTGGDSAKKTVTVTIDNKLSKGLDYFLQQGLDLVTVDKFDDAITAERVALKINPNSAQAKIVMARAYLGKGVLDSAQKYAEDAVAADPTNDGARDLLSAIDLKRAFSIYSRGTGTKTEVLANIGTAMQEAVENRRKTLDGRLDKFGPVDSKNLLQYVALCMEAGRYGSAISQLEAVQKNDTSNIVVADWLIYAYMRAGRFSDAAAAIDPYVRKNKLDAYGDALLSIQRAMAGDNDGSDKAMKDAILEDSQNLGVRTAQAYIALRRGKNAVLSSIATDLEKDAGERPEVNYYLAAVYNALGRYDDGSQRFLRAVLAEPLCYDVYVQTGNNALILADQGKLDKGDVDYQYQVAKVYYETALKARPESAEALAGLALTYAYLKDDANALKYAQAATSAGKGYAAAWYTLAFALSKSADGIQDAAIAAEKEGRHQDADKLYAQASKATTNCANALNTAGKLDPAYLGGLVRPPKLKEAYTYFVFHGKLPLLSPPGE